MNQHVSDGQLSGYLHQTLSDDRREEMDRHLVECSVCRTRVADNKSFLQHIVHDLLANLKAVQPTPQMTYAALASHLKPLSGTRRVWKPSHQLLPRAVALIVLAASLVMMFVILRQANRLTPGGATPALSINTTTQEGVVHPPDADTGRGWYANADPQNYEFGLDHFVAHSGRSSGYLKSKIPQPAGYATLMQVFRADDYRGTRLRLSGYIKTDQVGGWAGLWLRVDGPDGQSLSFDNMQDRPIQGSLDWTRYEIVLDVPEASVNVAFGVLLQGSGTVWIDDAQFDILGSSTATAAAPMVDATVTPRASATTRPEAVKQPPDLDFEVSAVTGELSPQWLATTTDPKNYAFNVDETVVHSGKASGHIQSKASATGLGFAALSQGISANDYRGNRLRLSGYLRIEKVEGSASLYMRIDGSGQGLRFDNMDDRPLNGTMDWHKVEIVLDVPTDSTHIVFGVLLQGKGAVWVDELRFEAVGEDVPTTDNPTAKQRRPLNLDFES